MSEPVVLEREMRRDPSIRRVPERSKFCDRCDAMAVVQLDAKIFCRQHAIEALNLAHQTAVEEVNRIIRGES